MCQTGGSRIDREIRDIQDYSGTLLEIAGSTAPNAVGSQLPTELLFSVKGIVLCAQTWRDGTVLDAI